MKRIFKVLATVLLLLMVGFTSCTSDPMVDVESTADLTSENVLSRSFDGPVPQPYPCLRVSGQEVVVYGWIEDEAGYQFEYWDRGNLGLLCTFELIEPFPNWTPSQWRYESNSIRIHNLIMNANPTGSFNSVLLHYEDTNVFYNEWLCKIQQYVESTACPYAWDDFANVQYQVSASLPNFNDPEDFDYIVQIGWR